MSVVIELGSEALVGQFQRDDNGKISLEGWMKEVWEPYLGYLLKLFVLVHHYMGFTFISKDDAKKIMGDC